jgi:hypothetical protein
MVQPFSNLCSNSPGKFPGGDPGPEEEENSFYQAS